MICRSSGLVESHGPAFRSQPYTVNTAGSYVEIYPWRHFCIDCPTLLLWSVIYPSAVSADINRIARFLQYYRATVWIGQSLVSIAPQWPRSEHARAEAESLLRKAVSTIQHFCGDSGNQVRFTGSLTTKLLTYNKYDYIENK